MYVKNNGACFSSSQRGGVLFRLVLVVLTLVVIGAAIVWVLRSSSQKHRHERRKAIELCEYGLFEALQAVKSDPDRTRGISKTQHNGGWYAVDISRAATSDGYEWTIAAEGHSGSATQERTMTMSLHIRNGDSTWTQKRRR